MLLACRFGTSASVLLLHWLPNPFHIPIVLQPLVQFMPFCSIFMLALFYAYFCLLSSPSRRFLLLLHSKPPATIDNPIPFISCKHQDGKKKIWIRPCWWEDCSWEDWDCSRSDSDEAFLRRCSGKNLKQIQRALQHRGIFILDPLCLCPCSEINPFAG